MNPTRPIVTLSALTCAALFFAAGPRSGVAQEPSPSPEAATTAIAATPSPSPSPTPRQTYRIRPRPKATAQPSPSPTPTVLQTLSPSDAVEPQSSATARAAAPAQAAHRTRSIPASPSPTPTATANATQSTIINDGTAPVYTPPPNAAGAPTPIPTQPPTPRPLAASQPSIPDSLADPNVRGIIERPIRQLSQVGWMQGTWSVTGVTNKEDGTTLPLEPTTYVFSPIMRNRWMFGADGKAKDYIYLTFDPFARHWVALRFGSNPSYGMWVSEKGWVGNRIDFITNFSYVNGRQYRRRLTIIHKDARTFGIYETEQTPDGSFIPDDAYEFKRL